TCALPISPVDSSSGATSLGGSSLLRSRHLPNHSTPFEGRLAATPPFPTSSKAMEKVPMTPRGAQLMREELSRLKEERPKISREIGIAREHGGLCENAED